MPVTIEQIRTNLPDWPDDVLDQWLVKHANRPGFGWPPPDPLTGLWRYIITNPISWWRDVSWELVEMAVEPNDLSAVDQGMVAGMFAAYFEGGLNAYSSIGDGRERTLSILRYLHAHGRLPRPIIAMRIADGLLVVDGSHRVLAVLFRRRFDMELVQNGAVPLPPSQPVWVGQHESGEYLH